MKRYSAACLVLALAAGVLIAVSVLCTVAEGTGGESTPNAYSGLERMVFQNGVSPTAGYSGILFYGISEESTSVTKGDLTWPADTLVQVGNSTNATGDMEKALFKVDISALPDSAIINRVELHLLLMELGTGYYDQMTTFVPVHIHRLLKPFTTNSTWDDRWPDSTLAWQTAGAVDPNNTGPNMTVFGGAKDKVSGVMTGYQDDWSALDSYSGYPIASGWDSLYSAYSLDTPGTKHDSRGLSEMCYNMTGLDGGTAPYWIRYYFTDIVNAWHTDRWLNGGVGIRIKEEFEIEEVSSYKMIFHGITGVEALSPRLVVYYVDPTALPANDRLPEKKRLGSFRGVSRGLGF